jgi:hypothetical protein
MEFSDVVSPRLDTFAGKKKFVIFHACTSASIAFTMYGKIFNASRL